MRIQTMTLAAVAAMALGAAACTPAETDKPADDTGEVAEATGDSLQEEAAQVGSAIAAGASEVAQEVDEATDNLAREADKQKAETKTDTKGN
ncbi:hypothetical protein [Brevundimonas sp.]|uniref:hypothetical protein n=1 Tax=Brevundimonas sp. TaxID=1871086 RepID=UPI00272F4A31|nr:hypothetical protein [Brevundimonas sp.]MDP1913853.1 hypothetical protein [Brevundimonas sp.]